MKLFVLIACLATTALAQVGSVATELTEAVLKKMAQSSAKELAEIGALNVVPFSATDRIGLEDATRSIENWISPKVVP